MPSGTRYSAVSLDGWNLYGRDTAANGRKPLEAGVESDAVILVGPIVGAVTDTTGRQVTDISPQAAACSLVFSLFFRAASTQLARAGGLVWCAGSKTSLWYLLVDVQDLV